MFLFFFFFKQKTAYEVRISDWSSDVCSSDLGSCHGGSAGREGLWGVARQFSAGADSDPTASDRPLQALALPRFPSQQMIHLLGKRCRQRGQVQDSTD